MLEYGGKRTLFDTGNNPEIFARNVNVAGVDRIARALNDTHRVERIAPGHCTGEPAFYRFRNTWKDRYTYAGVGSVIGLP